MFNSCNQHGESILNAKCKIKKPWYRITTSQGTSLLKLPSCCPYIEAKAWHNLQINQSSRFTQRFLSKMITSILQPDRVPSPPHTQIHDDIYNHRHESREQIIIIQIFSNRRTKYPSRHHNNITIFQTNSSSHTHHPTPLYPRHNKNWSTP